MATLVQPAPPPEQQVYHQQHHHHHHHVQNRNQQHHHAAQYTAAIPVLFDQQSTIPGMQHPNIYKQVNIIPGLDAENAVVDTGVKVVRNLANQAPVSTNTATANEFDGKRMRRSIQRRTVDYNASTVQMIKHRLFRRSILQRPIIQPDPLYYTELVQPQCILHNPINSVTTRFVRASTNKVRCPVFTVAWTPEGRRVVTGTSSGEFTLWNGLTFNFETILQAHESAVRAMEWSYNDMWLLSGDHNGVIKYWQSNMNNVKMLQAHNDPIRGLSFCPTDNKFATCSDDGLVKVWDFYKCQEERTLRGHGADVKCLGWHPSKSIVASGSKDSQQPLKLWDPKSGTSLATIHGHKSTVMDLNWNKNGNWLLTGSRDRLLKVFDIRMMKEMYTFRGHKKEAASVHWHPLYEEMFASGGSDGSIMFWLMGCGKELGLMNQAHDGMIWDLKWHPLGHILCSASNDHTTKFWTRNRPGDKMRDKYNLNVLPAGFEDDYEYELPTSSQSEGDSQLDSSLDSSFMSTGTPGKKGKSSASTDQLTKGELNTPVLKALLQQTTLEVCKPSSKEAPAQIYTVTSNLRANAPEFKIDRNLQQEALEDQEMLEIHREKQLRGRLNVDENAIMAPSLLDLDIVRPDFLKDVEWDNDSEDPPPFIEDLKRKAAEKQTAQQQQLQQQMQKQLQEQQHQQVMNNNMPPPSSQPWQPPGNAIPNGPSFHENQRPFEEPTHNRTLFQEPLPPPPIQNHQNFEQNHGPNMETFPPPQNRPTFEQNHGPNFLEPSTRMERPFHDRPPDHFNGSLNGPRPPRMDEPKQFDGPHFERKVPFSHEPSRPPPPQQFNGHPRFDAPQMNNNQFKNNMEPNNGPPFRNTFDDRKPPGSFHGGTRSGPDHGRRWEDERLSDRWQDERISDNRRT